MCQQILQFCSISAKPLLLAGSFLSLLLAIAIFYTGYTTNELYRDIDPEIADTRSIGYHLQLTAAVYLGLVTGLSCHAAHYDHKYSTRALAGVTTLNFFLALAAIFMVPNGQQLSQPFESTLKQAAERYNFTDNSTLLVSSTDKADLLALPSISNGNGTGPQVVSNQTKDRQVRWANEHRDISAENATKIWDKLQGRGCCGITNSTVDWRDKIPKSCCSAANVTNDFYYCNQADSGHQQGCLALIGSASTNLVILLGLIALVNFYLATISGISAYKTYSYSEASQSAYT